MQEKVGYMFEDLVLQLWHSEEIHGTAREHSQRLDLSQRQAVHSLLHRCHYSGNALDNTDISSDH